ncbi:MAG: tRNA (adenosine(37)-N6)-threonylcarbamoyltransferase complex ATPase subunit type 1 TsaE [Thermoplasmata archaeon]|nr:MAG: tRNA (adenosine(37)-N6)-threonylcarbamoyltransferase complex ATPase subunit type 1 TsaE [Thermoplasmata archaeon]
MREIYISNSAKETEKIGEKFAEKLKKGDIIGFSGELGSGKTTFIKGIVKKLCNIPATSPSFVLINEYNGKIPVFHFDLYRLENEKEIETTGWEEYIGKGIILIEWIEKIKKFLPDNLILVKIEILGDNKRKIKIKRGRK